MKKVVMIMLIGGAVYMAAPADAARAAVRESAVAFREWKKSSAGTWAGNKDGKMVWYKLDKKGGLWRSGDGTKWTADPSGAWSDKEGKWLKIHNKQLVWSTDGKSWAEVPEWKWEGADGKWYKFDANWALWVNE